MWRPIRTRASVRRDLPEPSNVVVVVLCIVREIVVRWELFKSVICLYWDLIYMYISRVLVLHYNLERSWFQGLLLSLFSYVAWLYLSCGVSSDAKSVPRIWGRQS